MTPPDTLVPDSQTLVHRPGLQESGRASARAWVDYAPGRVFREAKSVSARVLLDFNAVVHLVDAQNLGVAAVAPELVVLAHDQRLDRLGRTKFGAQAPKTAGKKPQKLQRERLKSK